MAELEACIRVAEDAMVDFIARSSFCKPIMEEVPQVFIEVSSEIVGTLHWKTHLGGCKTLKVAGLKSMVFGSQEVDLFEKLLRVGE